jgi:hypothetical protein
MTRTLQKCRSDQLSYVGLRATWVSRPGPRTPACRSVQISVSIMKSNGPLTGEGRKFFKSTLIGIKSTF